MEMNEQMMEMLEQAGLTPLMEGDAVMTDVIGPIILNEDRQRVALDHAGMPIMDANGSFQLMLGPDGKPMVYTDDADDGLSVEAIMAYLPMIEGFLWPEMQGAPVILPALAGDAASVAMVQDKLGVFGALASSGPAGLRDKAESLTQKTVDFVGGIISSALGNIGMSDDGEAMDFPTEIDRSTGVIRILGEIGLFLQSFDTFASKMAPNYDRPDNYMVELFLGNLDSLMANVFNLMDMDMGAPAE